MPRRWRERVRAARLRVLGTAGGAAFGDYAAGSNHVLPTGGAARFSGPLGAGDFRRRQALVSLPEEAARALAPHVASVARAEGFPVHAESAEARADGAPDASRGDQMAITTPPRAAEIERSTRETASACAWRSTARANAPPRPGVGFPRPHARPARAPRAARPRRGGDRRPRDRLPPHDRGRRDRARAGARPGARRPQRHRPLRRRDRADGRGARRVRDRRQRPAVLRLRGHDPGGRDRRLRHRAGRGVLPRRRQQRAADGARAAAGRHQRAPHGRGSFKALRARCGRGLARRLRDRLPSTKGVL